MLKRTAGVMLRDNLEPCRGTKLAVLSHIDRESKQGMHANLEIRQAVLPLFHDRLLGLGELLFDRLPPVRLHCLRFALELPHLRRYVKTELSLALRGLLRRHSQARPTSCRFLLFRRRQIPSGEPFAKSILAGFWHGVSPGGGASPDPNDETNMLMSPGGR